MRIALTIAAVCAATPIDEFLVIATLYLIRKFINGMIARPSG